MKKTLLGLILLLAPIYTSLSAQQKIAMVNANEIMVSMPDTKAMQTELEKLQKSYEDNISSMKDELKKKYEDYVAKESTMPEPMKLRKQQELQDIEKRINEVTGIAVQDIQKKQEELAAPIRSKIMDAIKKVGDENGFAYILDATAAHYTGAAAIDATKLVKAKLGLKS